MVVSPDIATIIESIRVSILMVQVEQAQLNLV